MRSALELRRVARFDHVDTALQGRAPHNRAHQLGGEESRERAVHKEQQELHLGVAIGARIGGIDQEQASKVACRPTIAQPKSHNDVKSSTIRQTALRRTR